MSSLLERIKWVLIEYRNQDPGLIAELVIREIESTHRICSPDEITEHMIEESFKALPAHYDPPDLTRRPWHALKARRRYAAMVRGVKSILVD